MNTMTVHELKLENFQSEVVDSPIPVLIDFWAPWCGPCRMLKPVMERVAKDYDGRVKVMAANVDEQPDLAGAFGVQGIPMVVLMKGRKPVDAFSGYQPYEAIKARLDRALG
jgi:thioredoxin 1